MAIAIQLHVYSGRPDPVWIVSDSEADRLTGKRQMLFERASAPGPAPVGLGYRGFTIFDVPEASAAKEFIAEAAMLDEGRRSSFISGEPDVEDQLLRTARDKISPRVFQHVEEALRSGPLLRESFTDTACPPCGGGSAPQYDPAYWNNDLTRLRRNNCYNYANNQATNTFAQPGRASGQVLTALECGNVRAAAERDGLKSVPTVQASIPGWYVALVVWPGEDYHWYRQDINGCWSHKPGRTEATNLDHAGKRIADPQSCDRGPYTNFCTFMSTDAGVRIG
jgi:hypothetical protein